MFGACSDDGKISPIPEQQFDFVGESVSLENANLYLIYEFPGTEDKHMYREYFISNGTYVEGGGWSLTDYVGATYVIAFQVGGPADVELVEGNYPLFYTFSTAPQTSRIAWVSIETEQFYYTTPEGTMKGKPVMFSGGFNHGDILTVQFRGTLEYDDTEMKASGDFNFTGQVQDLRPALAQERAAAKGGSTPDIIF